MASNAFADAAARYIHDTPLMVRELWGPYLSGNQGDGAPDKWQDAGLVAYDRGDRGIAFKACHGPGKGLPDDTIIPTPKGECRWGDLKPGDEVWGPDGRPTSVTAVYPRGRLPVFRVGFTDGTSLTVDGDHLWAVEEPRADRGGIAPRRILETRALDGHLRFSNGPAAGRRFRLPRHEAVHYPDTDVPVNPYLLGVWLGDGSAFGRITNVDTEIHETVREAGGYWKHYNERAPTGVVPGLATRLRHLGLAECRAWEKSVPICYKFNAIWVREELLAGLLDTDGSVDAGDGGVEYVTTSQQLAQDVAWIVRSLGGIARVSAPQRKTFLHRGERRVGRPAYRIRITVDNPRALFRITRKRERCRQNPETRYLHRWLDSIEPAGEAEVTCISVAHPTQTYLASDFILTHNTAVLAWIVLKQLLFVFPQRTVLTAPSGPQLWDALWNEVLVWFHRLPMTWQELFVVKGDRIELKVRPEDSWVSARTCRAETPEALQGVHCAGGRVLIGCDEGSGIPDPVYEAGAGSMAQDNATTILISNPTKLSGLFYDVFNKPGLKERWTRFTVSKNDSPRVPESFVQDIIARYGEGSNPYRVRVLGEFPTEDSESYIPMELVQSAMDRDLKITPQERRVWGVDPSRGRGDRTTVCIRQGNVVPEKITQFQIREPDTMVITGKIKHFWDETEPSLRPEDIFVDAIGYGAGVADRLRELGLPARAINVAEAPTVGSDHFFRLRDQLWGAAKHWLETRICKLPNDEDLKTELTRVGYDFRSSGEIIVQRKDEMKKTLGFSPDVAEAFILTFARDASRILSGRGGRSNWKEPLKRNLKGVTYAAA